MKYTKEYLTTTRMRIELGNDWEKNDKALMELCRITGFRYGIKYYPDIHSVPKTALFIGVYFDYITNKNDGSICFGTCKNSFCDDNEFTNTISVDEFLDNIVPEFVVGEWYEGKCGGDRWIFKYLETNTNNDIKCSLCSTPHDNYIDNTWSFIPGIENIKKVTNMEEVYKLFPKERTKKIIGYKSPFKMLGSCDWIDKGEIFSKTENEFFYTNNGIVKKKNPLPIEIVEQWEPVYEEDEKIEIGGYNVKFTIPNETTIDGNIFTLQFWEAAKLISSHSKAKIMVGCSKQFDVSSEIINKILGRLKK